MGTIKNRLSISVAATKTSQSAFHAACVVLVLWLFLNGDAFGQAQFTYTTNDGAITITGYVGSADLGDIPGTINGLPVTQIGNTAFVYGSKLTSISIPASVTNIGFDVFFGCTNLTNITVDAFSPNHSSVDGILFNKDQSTLLAFPSGKAGGYSIPTNVTSIARDAFKGCAGLTSVTIPQGVTNIGDAAFASCSSLAAILIPNSVLDIQNFAFYQCSNLADITVPASVTNIGIRAFASCPSLVEITVDVLNSTFCSADGVLFNKSQTMLLQYPAGITGNHSIPISVTHLGPAAFQGCFNLADIMIPESVTSIGLGVFDSCSSLTNVQVPNSVISLGSGAFVRCSNLVSVTIGDNLSYIGDGAFSGCANLTEVFMAGNAPAYYYTGATVFKGANNVVVYYLPGTFGWGATYCGRPTALWRLASPLILRNSLTSAGGGYPGIPGGGFGFVVTWATNAFVTVETCTNFANPTWIPLQTNELVNGSFYVSDSNWTNYTSRFYRLRSP